MKKANRILSALLCLVLLLGVLPVSALADDAEKPVLNVSRSKTATALTSDWTSQVTLSLPSAEEKLATDVLLVLDASKCTKTMLEATIKLLDDLKTQTNSGANIKVGIVMFKGNAVPFLPLTEGADLQAIRNTLAGLIKESNSDTKAAVRQYVAQSHPNFMNGGTNLPAGLQLAKNILEADTSVADARKYMVLVSDGNTYLFCHETADGSYDYTTAYTRSGPDTQNYGGISEATFNWNGGEFNVWFENARDTGDWDEYLKKVELYNGNYTQYDYVTTAETLGSSLPDYATPVPSGTTNRPVNSDVSRYQTAKLYRELQSKYNCYYCFLPVNDQYDTAMTMMKQITPADRLIDTDNNNNPFESITADIIYAVGAGSTVVDTMGEKFDFGGLKTMTLTVGGTELSREIDGDTAYFGGDKDTYRFKVEYDSANDKFIWTINENVSNFAPVKLTYTVKLKSPETAEGTYGVTDLDGDQFEDETNKSYNPNEALYTNDSAILTPKDSQNVEGKTLEFPKPSVSYSVDSNGDPILPIVGSLPILWLNMEDHYSYIVGYPDGTVQPNGKITRAEVATIFFRLLSDDTREAFWSSTNDYSDVSADKWYNNAVSTLSRLGVISGYPDGTFRPDASITRAEFAKIAVSFCKYGSTTYSGCFSDVKASDWFSTCVETARNSNLIAGYPDGTFRPNNAITRAEACTIVNRTLGRKPAKNHLNISGRINWPDCADTEWFYADMMEATNSHDYQMVGLVEDWNRKLPQRDWAALETEWSHAYSAPGGEVGR